MDMHALLEQFGFGVEAGHETAAFMFAVSCTATCALLPLAAVFSLMIAATTALGSLHRAFGPFLIKLFAIEVAHLFLLAFFVRSKMLNIVYHWAMQFVEQAASSS